MTLQTEGEAEQETFLLPQQLEASGVYVVQLFFLPITGQIFGDQP